MKQIKLFACLMIIAISTLNVSCSKEDIDISEENIEEFNPEIEETSVLSFDYDIDGNVTSLTTPVDATNEDCLFGWVFETFGPNGEEGHEFIIGAGHDFQIMWGIEGALEPHTFNSMDNPLYQGLTFTLIDPCTQDIGGTYLLDDYIVEITEVGEIGEPIKGTFNGLLSANGNPLVPFQGSFDVIRTQ